MAVASPSSLHIVEEHHHHSWKEKQSAQLLTLLGLGFVTVYTMGYYRPILVGHNDSSIAIVLSRSTNIA